MRYAVRNLIRLKARCFLTFSIILAILFLSMFGVLIVRLCEDNRERFYGPLDGTLHVTDDNIMPFFTYDAAEFLDENSDGIAKISAVWERAVYFSDMVYLGKDDYLRNTYAWERAYYPAGTLEMNYHEGFLLCAVTAMDILEEVYGEDLVMLEGTMISRENNLTYANKIVISTSVAEMNGLKLGDLVHLDPFSVFREEEGAARAYLQSNTEYEPYEYIIGGIYENRIDNTLAAAIPSEINENKVYVPISTLTDMARDKYLLFYGEKNFTGDSYEIPTLIPDRLYFHIDNMKSSKQLEEMINEIGFSKNILLTPYTSDAASSPSARLSEIISMLLVAVIVFGFGIFVLAVLFNMKARHRELSVLVALGEKRSKVSFSFFAEIIILVMISLLLGILFLMGAVALLAVPLSNYLYSSELSSRISYESADSVLLFDSTQSAVSENMADFTFLFGRYILPSAILSAVLAMIVLFLIFGIVSLYVKNINALSGVGGKE